MAVRKILTASIVTGYDNAGETALAASALLTAGATPIIITTTNINGSLAFSVPASADLQGISFTKELDFTASPLKSAASGTATTIVAPVSTGVIWRITAYYYIGN